MAIKLVITPDTVMEAVRGNDPIITSDNIWKAIRGNIPVKNLISNHKDYRLDFFAPERFQTDMDERRKALPKKTGAANIILNTLEEVLKAITIVPREAYANKLPAAGHDVKTEEYIEYVALAEGMLAEGIWDDSTVAEAVKRLQITTRTLYDRLQITIQCIEYLEITARFGIEVALQAREFATKLLHGQDEKHPGKSRLDALPDLEDVDAVQIYGVETHVCDEYGILIIPFHETALVDLKNAGLSKEDAYQELILGFSYDSSDNWEIPEDREYFGPPQPAPDDEDEEEEVEMEEGEGAEEHVASQDMIEHRDDLSDPSKTATAQIFIPQDVLGYDKDEFIKAYLTEDESENHPLEEITRLNIPKSRLVIGAKFILLFQKRGNQLLHLTTMEISKPFDEVQKMINNFYCKEMESRENGKSGIK